MLDNVINIVDLSVGYRTNRMSAKAIHNAINISVKRGVLTSILGANGSGKSTFIKTLCGMIDPLKGDVFIDGKSLSQYNKTALSKKIGVVLTDRDIDGCLKVEEVVSLGRYPYTGFFGKLQDNDISVINKSLQDVGALSLKGKYISSLSDGERQKVMIAKALSQECEIIILDEPAAFLDVKSRIEIMNLLRNIAHNKNKTILMSTHDLELALQLSDRLCIMSRRYGVEEGYTEDVVLSGGVSRIFETGSVEFDMADGAFKHNKDTHLRVFVNAEGELRYWMKNALARMGFLCVISEDDNIDITVKAEDISSINIYYKDKIIKANTIENMVITCTEISSL